jgi:hypothetical protein
MSILQKLMPEVVFFSRCPYGLLLLLLLKDLQTLMGT